MSRYQGDQAVFRLREYFETAEATAGLRSIHGPLIDLAQSGATQGGLRDPEARLNDGYLARVRSNARTAHALAALGGPDVHTLWRAFGPTQWPPDAKKALGELAGLLAWSTKAREAYEAWAGEERVRRGEAWERRRAKLAAKGLAAEPPAGDLPSLASWILALCRANGEKVRGIERELQARLDDALGRFRAAAGLPAVEPMRPARREPRVHVPAQYIEGERVS